MINIKVFASGSSGNLYVVENENTKILLECGLTEEKIRKLLGKKYNLGMMDGCIITHSHTDHCNMNSWKFINRFLNIYSTNELYNKINFKGQIIENKHNYKLGSIKFKPIDVYHGKAENYAYIFKDNNSVVLFATDLAHFNNNNLSNFAFDNIYIEINYIESILEQKSINVDKENAKLKLKRQINTHMELNNAIDILKTFNLSKCKSINAIHLSKECANKDIIKNVITKEFNIPCNTYCGVNKNVY